MDKQFYQNLLLKEIKEIISKLKTPSLINDEERLCSNCKDDIGLEYMEKYEAFDDGYNEAILDCVKQLEKNYPNETKNSKN